MEFTFSVMFGVCARGLRISCPVDQLSACLICEVAQSKTGRQIFLDAQADEAAASKAGGANKESGALVAHLDAKTSNM